MPELPEVEVWRRALHGWMVGRRIVGVRVLAPTSVRARLGTRPVTPSAELLERVQGMEGGEVLATARHGKRLGVQVGEGWWLLHLGMSGRFERLSRDEPAPTHARVGWGLDDGQVVWFCDARRFGALVPLDSAAALREGLGPDALEPLDGESLAARFRGRRAVKVALMDQSCLAGLGNIHAAEALWRARVAPARRVSELSVAEWAWLAEAIPRQLRAAIDQMSEVDGFVYVTDGGEHVFAVYGREGLPCPRCGTPVARTVLGGRSTFWCPRCQPAEGG